jgi:short-subunit dehydrogenase
MEKKVGLVTGSSSGLGRDIAKLLCEKGLVVYVTARRNDELEKLKKECSNQKGQIKIISGDLIDKNFRIKLISEIIKKEGKIDYLINNAGYGKLGGVDKISFEDLKGMIDLDILALQHLCSLVLPSMKENHSGRIINISSIAAIQPPPYFATYNSAKYAVHGFTRSLSYELKGTGVSTSAVFPARMSTPFWARAFKCKNLSGTEQEDCVKKWTEGSSTSLPVAKRIVRKLDSNKLIILPNGISFLAYHFLRHFRFIGNWIMKTKAKKAAEEVLGIEKRKNQ